MVDIATLDAVPALLSGPRLARYAQRYSGRTDLALRLYAWNLELTTAFWGPIAVLEVVVRNAVHDAMRRDRRDDWWNLPEVRLMDRERRALDSAIATLRRRGIADPGPDQVVAATSLGLWVGLTDAGIPRHPTLSYETALWQPRIVRAFPNLGTVRRKELHRKLDDLRRFRNRLAHHEPVFDAPLSTIRQDILFVAGAVHDQAGVLIGAAHRIDQVLERKRTAVERGATVI